MKKTIEEIYMMRGLLVLLVMICHLWTPIFRAGLSDFSTYSLPLFFFISGYFMKGKPLKAEFQKRWKSLGKPFLIYFFSFALAGGLILHFSQDLSMTDWLRSVASELLGQNFMDYFFPGLYLKTYLHRLMTVMWFFIQLILASILVTSLLAWSDASLKRKSCISAVCMMISGLLYSEFGTMPLQLQMLFFETGVMMLGSIAHDCGIFTEEKIKDVPSKLLITVLCLMLAYQISQNDPGADYMAHGTIGSYNNMTDVVSAVAQMAAGAIGLYELCTMLKKVPVINNSLDYLGRHSMDYIYMHLAFAWLFSFIGFPIAIDYTQTDAYDGSALQILMFTLIFLGNLVLCTVFSKLLSKKDAKAVSGSGAASH